MFHQPTIPSDESRNVLTEVPSFPLSTKRRVSAGHEWRHGQSHDIHYHQQ